MSDRLSLSSSRKGAWIINTTKHLLYYGVTDPGLHRLDNIFFAGKCGSLLIKLSADDKEQLSHRKVTIHARLCGIGQPELSLYLGTLKSFGCIDWDKESTIYEVLAFSRNRVLTTTSKILESLQLSSEIEKVLSELLEFCLLRPRLKSEIQEYFSTILSEPQINELIGLAKQFELLGYITIPTRSEELYFNGYQFGDRAKDIGKALAALSSNKREQLDVLIKEVAKTPGLPPENLSIQDEIKTLALGLGIIEVSEVSSKAGNAKFLTIPNLAPPSVGKETSHLEDDVFHHAKMLLSSLRFGELRSMPSRGQIIEPAILVEALINRDRVGPCTAIGEDYVLLECEGVIKTFQAPNKPGKQFYMQLRRHEPAEIVLGLLKSGKSEIINAKSLPKSLQLPLGFLGPEISRVTARRTVIKDSETIKQFLEELRT